MFSKLRQPFLPNSPATCEAAVSQSIATIPGLTYSVTFTVNQAASGGTTSGFVIASDSGLSYFTTGSSWSQVSYNFVATSKAISSAFFFFFFTIYNLLLTFY